MTQPGLGLHGFQSGELQFAEEAQQVQTEAGNPPGAVTRQALEQARAASASANNSPQPARQAGNTEDVDTSPPRIMGDQPDPTQTAFLASLQVAHDAAEAQRVEAAKLRDQLAVANAKTMEETIKRLEAEKAAIEAANESLKVTADAANAAKVAAEAVAAAAASSTSGGSGLTSVADTIAKAMKKSDKAKLHEECTFPRGITYPEWPPFDPSVKFNERDPLFVDGHVRALAWRKVWQAIKEHFEAARDEYAHSLYNKIMKVRVSALEKGEAEDACHLFYDGAKGRGNAIIDPLDPAKAVHVNAKVERAAHADRVHRMVVHTFTEFLNMMVIEKAYNAKHGGEYVRWRPTLYSHACAVREICEAIAAGGGGAQQTPSWTVSSRPILRPTMRMTVPMASPKSGRSTSSCSASTACTS